MTRKLAQPGSAEDVLRLLQAQGPLALHEIEEQLGLDLWAARDRLDDLGDAVHEMPDDRWAAVMPRQRGPRRRGLHPETRMRRAEQQARQADALLEVQQFRQRQLDGELLDWADVPRWIDDRAKAARVESGVPVAFAGPDDEWVRSVPSTERLEPLRVVSDALASRFGWQPAQAAAFVLAGVIPVSGFRIVTRRRFDSRGERITLDILNVELDEEPEAVAEALRRKREQLGARRQLSPDQLEKLIAVAKIADEHGDGQAGLDAFNRRFRDRGWHYSDRGKFRRAADRARERGLP